MQAILNFFIRYAALIYVLLALGLVLGFRRLSQARGEIREAVYGLEQEIARRHNAQAISALTLVGFFAAAEFILVVFLAPNLPGFSQLSTPTMNPLAVATGTLQAGALETLGVVTPASTATIQAAGCIPGQIDITFPKAGDEIKGKISLIGTADIPNFGFFKYEFSPAGSNVWSTIQADRSIKTDESLGNWDTSAIPPGDYELRLVVTDNQGNELPACVVPVHIKAP
jgi:hypothetical protein